MFHYLCRIFCPITRSTPTNPTNRNIFWIIISSRCFALIEYPLFAAGVFFVLLAVAIFAAAIALGVVFLFLLVLAVAIFAAAFA
jgi:hypothetical protein